MNAPTAISVAALAAALVTAPGLAGPAQAADCKPVSVVSARGTFEPQSGSWLQKPIGDRIAAALPGRTKYTELAYPAAPNFDTSPEAGVKALIGLLNTESAACPDQRYVLIGYSQGAQVTGDSLVAPAQRLVGQSAGTLSPAATTKIAAVLLFGDPRFVGAEPFNAGTYDPARNGDKPRAQGDLAAYAPRLRNYCTADDFVCQKGGNPLSHLAYFFNGMPTEATAFALQHLTP